MLKEIITYFTTPCRNYARRMGYLYETIALRERYGRNKSSWKPHLDNSKNFIISAAQKIVDRQKIIILGSGLLLDVPVKQLAGLFNEVILIDIVHLPEVRRHIKKYVNVRLLEYDVTNTAEILFENIRKKIMILPAVRPGLPAEIFLNTHPDSIMVVSCNTLSQLPVIPHLFTIKNMPDTHESVIESWCKNMIESHISWLFSLPCNVCMISDYYFEKKDKNEITEAEGSTVHEVFLTNPVKSWMWEIAPHGEESNANSKVLYVNAWYAKNNSD